MSLLFKEKEKPYKVTIINLPITILKDKKFPGTQKDFEDGLNNSHMVYIGKLSTFTTEQQIYSYFSRIGLIKRIIMGINRIDKTPCGFCFVE
jgi:nuclear cap-binding protein subunit 2